MFDVWFRYRRIGVRSSSRTDSTNGRTRLRNELSVEQLFDCCVESWAVIGCDKDSFSGAETDVRQRDAISEWEITWLLVESTSHSHTPTHPHSHSIEKQETHQTFQSPSTSVSDWRMPIHDSLLTLNLPFCSAASLHFNQVIWIKIPWSFENRMLTMYLVGCPKKYWNTLCILNGFRCQCYISIKSFIIFSSS